MCMFSIFCFSVLIIYSIIMCEGSQQNSNAEHDIVSSLSTSRIIVDINTLNYSVGIY